MIHKKEIQLVAMFFIVAILAGITLVTFNYAPINLDIGSSQTQLTGYVIAHDAEGKIKFPAETPATDASADEPSSETNVGNLLTGFATVKINAKDVTVPDIFVTNYGATGPTSGKDNKLESSGNAITERGKDGKVVRQWILGKESYIVETAGNDLAKLEDNTFKFVSAEVVVNNPSEKFRSTLLDLNKNDIGSESQPAESLAKYQIITSGDITYKFNSKGMIRIEKKEGTYLGTFTNIDGKSYPITLSSVDELKRYDGIITLLGTVNGVELYGDDFNNYYVSSGNNIVPWKLENQPAGTQIIPLQTNQETKTIDLKTSSNQVLASPTSRLGMEELYSKVFPGQILNLRDQTSLNSYNQLSQALRNKDNNGNFLLKKGETYSIYDSKGTESIPNIAPQLAQLIKTPADLKNTVEFYNNNQGTGVVSGNSYFAVDSTGFVREYQLQPGINGAIVVSDTPTSTFMLIGQDIVKDRIAVQFDDLGTISSLSYNKNTFSAGAAKSLGILDDAGKPTASQFNSAQLTQIFDEPDLNNILTQGAAFGTIKTNNDATGTLAVNIKVGGMFLSATYGFKENKLTVIDPKLTQNGNEIILSPAEYAAFNQLRKISSLSGMNIESNRLTDGNGNYLVVKTTDEKLKSIPDGLRQPFMFVSEKEPTKGKYFDGVYWHNVEPTQKNDAWTDDINGFTQKYKVGNTVYTVDYNCGKNPQGQEAVCANAATYTIKDSQGKEVTNPTVKAQIAAQINYETTGLRWQAAYQAALGAATLGNMMFCGNQDCFASWGKSIDNLFRSMFGFVMYPEDTFCKQYVDRGGNDGVAYVATPDGLIDVAAHVEGARSPLILRPNETAAPLVNVGEYLYKFTFYVKIPKYTTSGYVRGEPLMFNVELRGQKTVKLFNGDKRLLPGQEFSQVGNSAIVKYSPVAYNEICIVFSGTEITWRNPICNKIVEYQGGPTSIEEAAAEPGAVDYGSGSAGSGVPNNDW